MEKTFDKMGLERKKWLSKPMTFTEHPVLFGTLKGIGGGSSIAFNGHVDVVPVGDLSTWSHDPWSAAISDGKIWGRGTADMKSGVSAMIQALNIIQKCGFELRGDVFFHIVTDEEVVGFGSRQCAEKFPRPWIESNQPVRRSPCFHHPEIAPIVLRHGVGIGIFTCRQRSLLEFPRLWIETPQ